MKKVGSKSIALIILLSFAFLFGCGKTYNDSGTVCENNGDLIAENILSQESDNDEPEIVITDVTVNDTNDNIFIPVETTSSKTTKKYAVSKVDGLMVRKGASLSSEILGSLDAGDVVSYFSEEGGFISTVYKEQRAFVYRTYCDVIEFATSSEKAEKAIDLGCSLLGYPYVWGSQRYLWANGVLNGAFINGEFDCSAFVQYIYYISDGVILDVTTRTQVKNGFSIDKDKIKRGDLLFFTNASRVNKTGIERIGHVGIYFGNNYILHTSSDHAVIEPISDKRWSYFITARRVAV